MLAISNSINSPRHVNAADQGSERLRRMSALPPKASNVGTAEKRRRVPQPDSRTAANPRLFDHLVGAPEQRDPGK